MGPASDEDDAKEVAFLRARIVEAAREGDTPEIQYLVGISAAKRLLTASDEVKGRVVPRSGRLRFLEPSRAFMGSHTFPGVFSVARQQDCTNTPPELSSPLVYLSMCTIYLQVIIRILREPTLIRCLCVSLASQSELTVELVALQL